MGDRFYLLFSILFVYVNSQLEQDIYVSNLNAQCLKCLCAASSGCPTVLLGCASGYCGPFQISQQYFRDAVKGTPLESKHDAVYRVCSNNYDCASKVVKYYIARFARDCNKDGVTTCEDFLMINYNGAYGCEKPLHGNPNSVEYLKRFTNCTDNLVF